MFHVISMRAPLGPFLKLWYSCPSANVLNCNNIPILLPWNEVKLTFFQPCYSLVLFTHTHTHAHAHTHTHTHLIGTINEDMPIRLKCVSLGCGRQPESPRKSHADMRRMCRSTQTVALAGKWFVSCGRYNEQCYLRTCCASSWLGPGHVSYSGPGNVTTGAET